MKQVGHNFLKNNRSDIYLIFQYKNHINNRIYHIGFVIEASTKCMQLNSLWSRYVHVCCQRYPV